MRFSTTIGVNPAATIAFKHDFWSIRVHTTTLARGLLARSADKVNARDILDVDCHTRMFGGRRRGRTHDH